MHREAGRIPLLALRAWMGGGRSRRSRLGLLWDERPVAIKAPGGSRGIANHQKTGHTDKLKACRHGLQGFVQCMQPGSGL